MSNKNTKHIFSYIWLQFLKHRYIILIIFMALFLRTAYFIEMKNDPEFLNPNVDALYHDYWAWGIVSDQWEPPYHLENPEIQNNPYFRPPLYPYFLSLIYRIFGHSPLVPRILQMMIGILSCVILFLVTRKIFQEKIAFLCGALMAIYWAFIYFEKELREVVLLVFFLPLFILWMIKLKEHPNVVKSIFCGFLLGCIIITRPNFLLFLPLAMGWLYFYYQQISKKQKILYIAIFVLFTLLPVSGITIRNYIKGNDFVLISSNAGINFYVGNNPHSTGNTIALPPDIPLFRNAFMYPTIVKYVEKQQGKKLKHSEVSKYFIDKAMEYIKDNPGSTIARVFKKAVMFFGGVEIPSERDLISGKESSWVLKINPLSFAIVFSLCVIGLFIFFIPLFNRSNKKIIKEQSLVKNTQLPYVLLILLLVGIYFISYLPFFITSRFRISIIPFILIFASYMIDQLFQVFKKKNYSKAITLIAGFILVYILNSINYFNFQRHLYKAEYDRALAYTRDNNYEEAIKGYRKAIEIKPDFVDAYNNLGNMLREIGKTQEAIENYQKALQFQPDHYYANLNLGQIYYSGNDFKNATTYYSKALKIKPSEYIYNILSNSYYRIGKIENSQTVLLNAMEKYGRKPEFLKNLGILYAMQKKYELAKNIFLEVLNKDSKDLQTLINMGRISAEQNRPEEAEKYFRRVLQADPENKPAKDYLKKIKSQ